MSRLVWPENAIGWLFCGAGLLFAVATVAGGWAVSTLSLWLRRAP